VSKAPSKYSEINENDEWVAIQKFNTLLHFEEQKQALLREEERKRLIKQALDTQIDAKKQREDALKDENALYVQMYEEHGKILEQREKEKVDSVKQKIMNDKSSRDQQLKDEARRRKVEAKESMQQEKEYIKRLKTEMEQERKLQQDKRKQEREYLHKMMLDNEKNKARMKDDELRQKDEDA
jgi:hypothetical protein